jgi:hypothetical protein
MTEKQFYEQVGGMMSDFSAEVPASVYQSMRRKLWWSRFTSFDMSRLNLWYCVALIGAAGAIFSLSSQSNAAAKQADSPSRLREWTMPVSLSVTDVNGTNSGSALSGSSSSPACNRSSSISSSSNETDDSKMASTSDEIVSPQTTQSLPVGSGASANTAEHNNTNTVNPTAPNASEEKKKGKTLKVPLFRDKK